ncbi:hypothetical protein A4R35_00675 [Thermogemmatispora tikiterensis]|uniref:Uncharacterized protein n=1 Tax=Thermogemmatispora tikiterensis TaxID=1825093 RepID=A0A328VIB1_9CHLR|nr:hypothetical protein A4R35_00675 [Thermogemmatispora tikiterensis]
MDSVLIVALRETQVTMTSWRSPGARLESLHLYAPRALLSSLAPAAVGEPIWPETRQSQASTRG